MIVVKSYQNASTQLFIGMDNSLTHIFGRTKLMNASWSDWDRLDNFGCSTPSALAELLGVNNLISKAPINPYDFNDAHSSGIYSGRGKLNQPFEYSVVLVMQYSTYECVQLGFDILSGSLKERFYVNGTWSEWVSRW